MSRDIRLIDYLPPVLRSVAEYAAITDSEQPEFDKAWNALEFIMDNQFLETATVEGIAEWEKELNITPKSTETLEERKRRIKSSWICGAAYTYRWLAEWLSSTCGFDSALAVEDYTVRPILPVSADYLRLIEDMRQFIPAGIVIKPQIRLSDMRSCFFVGAALGRCVRKTLKTPTVDIVTDSVLTDENGNVLTDGHGRIITV